MQGDFIILQIRTGEESDERGHIVVREFEDFEWLDHCIKTKNDISGVIVRLRHIQQRLLNIHIANLYISRCSMF